MCLLSENAKKNPESAESVAELWAWRQLDGLLHTGSYEGLVTLRFKGVDVVDPWIREDAQFAEDWPDHQGEHAVADPWKHYGKQRMQRFVEELLQERAPELLRPKRGLADVVAGDFITYCGDGWAFDGDYEVVREADTYLDPAEAARARDALVIVEFMNDGTPMFFNVANLNEDEWEVID